MSRASDLEAARLAAERVSNRCEAIETANSDLLTVLAGQMLAEGSFIAERGRKGWQSAEREHIRAAAILEQWAKDLAAYLERDKPPMRPPLETITGPTMYEHLDPADGPISAQITSGLMSQASEGPVTADVARSIREAKTVDAKLDVAFGPVSPRAEIINLQCRAEYPRKGSEDRSSRIVRCGKLAAHVDIPGNERHAEWVECDGIECDPLVTGVAHPEPGHWGAEWDLPVDTVHITAAPANYAWCEATSGLRGYVGSATCSDCIARWDAHHGTLYDAKNDRRVTVARYGGTEPALEPIDDRLTRNEVETSSASGTAQFAIQPDAPEVLRINIHGTKFLTGTEMPGRSGILHVDYRHHENGPIEILGQKFEPDPIDWNAKGEATVSIPKFSEPGAPPPRQTQQRLTFAQVREHGRARACGVDHRSYSQVQAFRECGVKYALDDLDTPAWWNVGGTALHYACEAINRIAAQAGIVEPWDIETLWTNCLGRATSEAIAERPTVDTAHWRAAKKGSEGYDWWRINGVDMVRRWVARLTWLYDQGWRVAVFNGTPAIEYDCLMWVYGALLRTHDPIKVENIIDLVMTRDDGTLLIIDAKAGASAPDDTAQLGQYAHALNHALGGDQFFSTNTRIIGAYWLARTDMLTPVDVTKSDTATDLRELHPWDEIEYLITTMDAAESAGLYLPNKSKSDRFGCGSCGVRGLCPVGPS